MSQDKLEEIARLLGGISDKLDVVVRNLTPAQRHEVGAAVAGLGHLPEGKRGGLYPVKFDGYVATLNTPDADRRGFAKYGSHSALEGEQ